jgi:hypothetical protein
MVGVTHVGARCFESSIEFSETLRRDLRIPRRGARARAAQQRLR